MEELTDTHWNTLHQYFVSQPVPKIHDGNMSHIFTATANL